MNAQLLPQKLQARKELVMRGMQKALSVRAEAGMDFKSPICVYSLCDSMGITVRFNDINMEGMYDREPKPRIHVSVQRPMVRRTFTCAHELGHHVFEHGSTIDELKEDNVEGIEKPPNEILADAFAAFLVMPTLGLKEAFAKRGIQPNTASAIDMFSIACNFGVGQSTLVNHLAYGINLISKGKRDALGKITPKAIRTSILDEIVPEPLIVADHFWNSPTLDSEIGGLILMPQSVVVDTTMLIPIKDLENGRVFRAKKSGITRVSIPNSNWATYVRIAPVKYVGLARYRHLEEANDE